MNIPRMTNKYVIAILKDNSLSRAEKAAEISYLNKAIGRQATDGSKLPYFPTAKEVEKALEENGY